MGRRKKVQKKTNGNNPVTESHPFNIARVGIREPDVINQVTEVSRETSPHISEIRNAFSRCQIALVDGCYSPVAYAKAYRELQIKLAAMGLAKHIDWSPSL